MSTIVLPPTTTILACGDCDGGTFAPLDADPNVWTCDTCGHDITRGDITPNLEPGERLGVAFVDTHAARLAVTTAPWSGTCLTCGAGNPSAGHHHVRYGTTIPSDLRPCPESE